MSFSSSLWLCRSCPVLSLPFSLSSRGSCSALSPPITFFLLLRLSLVLFPFPFLPLPLSVLSISSFLPLSLCSGSQLLKNIYLKAVRYSLFLFSLYYRQFLILFDFYDFVFHVCLSTFLSPFHSLFPSCLPFLSLPLLPSLLYCRVEAAYRAGMKVFAVPDERMDASLFPNAHEIISSLFDFRPEEYGLLSFDGEEERSR